ncbi:MULTISPECIES: DUF423 domain-containing protein [Nitratireductor]|uniref:DUF423 domain-containing protein n=1 Tax=Nitratireductor TaxID=245876 RepID=UPI000D0DA4FD|nr:MULTISPECIES: DUF423 domain-containing protein [Nitratireductor]PSM17049.1 DUF423 domain-containing protein [Nitratireductor sp. StC3]
MSAARLLILAAGLIGAAGVALSAVAAHAGGGNVATAAQFLLFHAPALLTLGLLSCERLAHAAGLVLLAGVLLFAGDLLMRHFADTRLFAMAAPAGGTLMILGWLGVAGSALRRPRGAA